MAKGAAGPDFEAVEPFTTLGAREVRRVFYRRTSTRGDLTIEVEVEMEGFDSGQCVGIVASLVDDSGPQD